MASVCRIQYHIACDEGQRQTDLQRQIVPLAQHTRELDDGLHALHLALDDLVKVLLLHLREHQ